MRGKWDRLCYRSITIRRMTPRCANMNPRARLHEKKVRVLVVDQLQIGYIVCWRSDQLKNSFGSICNLKGKSLADHKIVES